MNHLLPLKHGPLMTLNFNKLTEAILATVPMLTNLGGPEVEEPTNLVARCVMVRKKRRAEVVEIFVGT